MLLPEDCLLRLQERIGYTFRRRDLLLQALTHRSFLNEHGDLPWGDNERLEFLGDAVLDLIVSQLLVAHFPDQPEGVLSRMRASLVNEAALADLARDLDVGSCLLLGRGEETSGGREKPGILADALEAVAAAVFTEAGFDTTSRVIGALFEPAIAARMTPSAAMGDAKSRLQEELWRRSGQVPTYRLVAEEGPSHARIFRVAVEAGGVVLAEGTGRSKKQAEQQAARRALEQLASGNPSSSFGDNRCDGIAKSS